jgi:hypothetical protein
MKNIFVIVLVLLFFKVQGQVDSTSREAVKLRQYKLTYLWTGRGCPDFINTEFKYGFKIRCAGCIVDKKLNNHNKRVIRKINRVYGLGWFKRNRINFLL